MGRKSKFYIVNQLTMLQKALTSQIQLVKIRWIAPAVCAGKTCQPAQPWPQLHNLGRYNIKMSPLSKGEAGKHGSFFLLLIIIIIIIILFMYIFDVLKSAFWVRYLEILT